MTVVTREELSDLVQEELTRLVREPTPIRHQLIGVMAETFAQRTDLQAILERLDIQGQQIATQGEQIRAQGDRIEALREDFNRQFAEHSRRMDGFAQRQEEHSRRMGEFAQRMDEFAQRMGEFAQRMDEFAQRMDALAQRQEEHSRRLDEHSQHIAALREDFNRGFALLSREIKRLDTHVTAMGARWGLMAEDAFRQGLADILAQETGLTVKRYWKMDTKGFVFGRPDQVEIDVAVQDGEHTLIEIKSSTSRQEVHNFARKVQFYEQEEGVEVKRLIIISPMLGPGAEALADQLGIDTFTSAHDVKT